MSTHTFERRPELNEACITALQEQGRQIEALIKAVREGSVSYSTDDDLAEEEGRGGEVDVKVTEEGGRNFQSIFTLDTRNLITTHS